MKINFIMSAAALSVMLFTAGSCGEKNNSENMETNTTTVEATSEVANEAQVNVDLENTKLIWKGEMLGVKAHEGTMKLNNANLVLAGDKVVSGSFEANMTSMVATDENYNEDYTKEKLIGHLSSPDFFDVENHPTASFEIKSVEGNTVNGTLTIRGTSSSESITDVNITNNDGEVHITGKLVFDRQKYGVAWKSTVKDMVLSDNIELKVDLAGKI